MVEASKATINLGAMLRLTEPVDTQHRSQTPANVTTMAQWFVDHEIAVVPTKDKRPVGGAQNSNLSTKGIKDQYGVVLGNGLIGIDFDEYHGAQGLSLFGVTRQWRSGSGKGYGILLRVPKELSEHGFELSSGITVRGTNQILVGPGSKHPSGGIYTLIQDIEIIDAPKWLVAVLQAKLDEIDSNEIELGEATNPEWLFKDARFQAKFEATNCTDRSAATYDIVAYAIERGASNEEASWIITNFKPARDKGNLQEELPRVIKKTRLLHEHPGKPCDSVGCKNIPDWMTKSLKLAFWDERPEFAYIKQASENRLVSHKAVMVAVLCRLAASIPTEIVLPPIVGKKASLNFFACFVGESGGGKGTATGLAEELFNFKQTGVSFTTSTPGSGEGVVSTYLKIKDNKWQQTFESSLINFDEIDNLKASSDRQGSTLSAILRQSFMGEQIGGTYSRAVKELLPHSYRMALQLSAQPLRSAGLLEDSDGGLPQRFTFVQTTNPECPDIDALPKFPASIEWRIPQQLLDLKNSKTEQKKPNEVLGKLDTETVVQKQFIEIKIAKEIEREIKLNRIHRLKTGRTGTEGHSDLVWLKIASLLAILDGRLHVTLKDGQLAKVIMQWSKQALNEIKEALSHKKLKETQARATAAADRAIYVENRTEQSKTDLVKSKVLEYVAEGLKLSGANQIKQKLRKHRDLVDDAVELLVKEGKLKFIDEKKDVLALIK